MNQVVAQAIRTEAVRVDSRDDDGISVETIYPRNIGFKLRIKGTAYVDGVGVDAQVVFEAWKKRNYFEDSDEFPPLTICEARQLAHLLMAIAEEADGWVQG